jgi:N-sulfoglucosamine sulfohydrolase
MRLRPNLLLITADDMNWDAVGAYGCPVEGTTPNIDQLASDGLRFTHAHVTIAVCQPSRSTLMTGRYPHRNGGEGFFHLRQPGVPILPESLRSAGYRVGILGKVPHSTPYESFQWDMAHDMPELGMGRNPHVYGGFADEFIGAAVRSGSPFFLMANSHDPHRPFYGNDKAEWYQPGKNPPALPPSLTFTPEAVKTPGFLPDLPDVRREISEYYASVRRCDDTVGAILQALRKHGAEDTTLVVFLSDNGMAFPFAKTNCYLHSTRTPWIMRWPGIISPGRADSEHLVSGIDLMPTLLEAVGVSTPPGVDGRSFMPLLRGEKQSGREVVFTQFHQSAGGGNYPMRCVQTKRFGYIFNPWSSGTRVFRNESQAGRTMQAMQAASVADPAVAERVRFFLHRVPEEFYDFEWDPHALHNLIDSPDHACDVARLRSVLAAWMEQTGDPAREAFRNRESPAAREDFMKETAALLGGRS